MRTLKPSFIPSIQVFMSFILMALCLSALSGCDNFYDALKFGDGDAEAQVDLGDDNRVILRPIESGTFNIEVDDGAQSPTLTLVSGESVQLTMQSDGFVRIGDSGTVEVQAGDIVIVRGSSQSGSVMIIRPSSSVVAPSQ